MSIEAPLKPTRDDGLEPLYRIPFRVGIRDDHPSRDTTAASRAKEHSVLGRPECRRQAKTEVR
jgi:hypothetical protein